MFTPTEGKMIRESLRFPAKTGFAANVDDIKDIMPKCVCDGRRTWKNYIHSPDAVRPFGPRHTELTGEKSEKQMTQSSQKNFSHVLTFFDVLYDIAKTNQGILSDDDRVWKMGETYINGKVSQNGKCIFHTETIFALLSQGYLQKVCGRNSYIPCSESRTKIWKTRVAGIQPQ